MNLTSNFMDTLEIRREIFKQKLIYLVEKSNRRGLNSDGNKIKVTMPDGTQGKSINRNISGLAEYMLKRKEKEQEFRTKVMQGHKNFNHYDGVGHDLRDLDITGSDFSYADFSKAKFQDADLSGVNFTLTYLEGADFTGVINLEDALGLEHIILAPQSRLSVGIIGLSSSQNEYFTKLKLKEFNK